MEAYSIFAEIYDRFMDNIPYDEWGKHITGILREYGIHSGLLCELGCGTGTMTRYLSGQGYDMIGTDISEEMLAKAREYDTDRDILYLNQDMRELELYGTVQAVVSVCDSMNYIMTYDDLCLVLKKVNNYLESGGIFIFDMKTIHFYSSILADSVQVDNREDATIIWENHYEVWSRIHNYELTMYIAVDDECYDTEYDEDVCTDEDTDGRLYERYTECHSQKAYTIEEVKKAVKDAGMEFVAVYDEKTHDEPDENSERVYFIVREAYQKGKYYNV